MQKNASINLQIVQPSCWDCKDTLILHLVKFEILGVSIQRMMKEFSYVDTLCQSVIQ